MGGRDDAQPYNFSCQLLWSRESRSFSLSTRPEPVCAALHTAKGTSLKSSSLFLLFIGPSGFRSESLGEIWPHYCTQAQTHAKTCRATIIHKWELMLFPNMHLIQEKPSSLFYADISAFQIASGKKASRCFLVVFFSWWWTLSLTRIVPEKNYERLASCESHHCFV